MAKLNVLNVNGEKVKDPSLVLVCRVGQITTTHDKRVLQLQSSKGSFESFHSTIYLICIHYIFISSAKLLIFHKHARIFS